MLRVILCAALLSLAAPAGALERIEDGAAPPPFTLQGLDGRTISLEDFVGHTTALLFWSTWSPRSAEMLADFKEYSDLYHDDGLRIIAINADGEQLTGSERASIERYVNSMDLPFPVLLDQGLETYAAYGVEALPSAVVLDAGGQVYYSLGGYPLFIYREELRDSFLMAMGRLPEPEAAPEVQEHRPDIAAEAEGKQKTCAMPRSRFCLHAAEREGGGDPAVMAVRLALCRGEVDEAQRMLRGIPPERMATNELRFALAHLLLLKGKNGAAALHFTDLMQDHGDTLGSWGLGLVALAEGRTGDALYHMEQAAVNGSMNTEAETAVLSYLLEFWNRGTAAPEEKDFLRLFTTLTPVRRCYGTLSEKG